MSRKNIRGLECSLVVAQQNWIVFASIAIFGIDLRTGTVGQKDFIDGLHHEIFESRGLEVICQHPCLGAVQNLMVYAQIETMDVLADVYVLDEGLEDSRLEPFGSDLALHAFIDHSGEIRRVMM